MAYINRSQTIPRYNLASGYNLATNYVRQTIPHVQFGVGNGFTCYTGNALSNAISVFLRYLVGLCGDASVDGQLKHANGNPFAPDTGNVEDFITSWQ